MLAIPYYAPPNIMGGNNNVGGNFHRMSNLGMQEIISIIYACVLCAIVILGIIVIIIKQIQYDKYEKEMEIKFKNEEEYIEHQQKFKKAMAWIDNELNQKKQNNQDMYTSKEHYSTCNIHKKVVVIKK